MEEYLPQRKKNACIVVFIMKPLSFSGLWTREEQERGIAEKEEEEKKAVKLIFCAQPSLQRRRHAQTKAADL